MALHIVNDSEVCMHAVLEMDVFIYRPIVLGILTFNNFIQYEMFSKSGYYFLKLQNHIRRMLQKYMLLFLREY